MDDHTLIFHSFFAYGSYNVHVCRIKYDTPLAVLTYGFLLAHGQVGKSTYDISQGTQGLVDG